MFLVVPHERGAGRRNLGLISSALLGQFAIEFALTFAQSFDRRGVFDFELGGALGPFALEGLRALIDVGECRVLAGRPFGFEGASLLRDARHRLDVPALQDGSPLGQTPVERLLSAGDLGKCRRQPIRGLLFDLSTALLQVGERSFTFGPEGIGPLLDAAVVFGDLGHRDRVLILEGFSFAFELEPGSLRLAPQIDPDPGDLLLGLGYEGHSFNLTPLARRLHFSFRRFGGRGSRLRTDAMGLDLGNTADPLGHGLRLRPHPEGGVFGPAADEYGLVLGLRPETTALVLGLDLLADQIGRGFPLGAPDLFLLPADVVEQPRPLGCGCRHCPLVQLRAHDRRVPGEPVESWVLTRPVRRVLVVDHAPSSPN